MEAVPKGTDKDMAKGSAAQNAENMAGMRRKDVENNYPELKRADFDSDEAFAEALREQYRALRESEYEMEVSRQCLEMFNASSKIRKINRDIWIKPLKDKEENVNKRDSAVYTACERPPMLDPRKPAPYVKNGGIACCAKTAVSVVAQVSDNLGYTGTDNIMSQTDRLASMASASGVHDAVGNKQYKKTGKLCDLVKSGEIGPGAVVSVPSPGNGGSGYHAMVLAGVRRDKNGNVSGYYLQGNNKTSYTYYDINDKSGRNTSQVICTATNQWMNERIDNELAGKTPEEMQAMINAAKGRMTCAGGSIDRLQSAETEMMSMKCDYRYGSQVVKFTENYEEDMGLYRMTKFPLRELPDKPADLSILRPHLGEVRTEIETPADPLRKSGNATAVVAEAKAAPVMTAEGAEPAATPAAAEDSRSVRDLFASMGDDSWMSLVSAYMSWNEPGTDTAATLRGDAAVAGATPTGNSLVDNLNLWGANEELPDLLGDRDSFRGNMDLAALLSGDKTASDDLFTPLLAALTEKDDKELDNSMKLALGFLTEFLGGTEKDPDNGVPSLSDFMAFLSDGRENVAENEQGRQALQTPTMSPVMLNMLRNGRA